MHALCMLGTLLVVVGQQVYQVCGDLCDKGTGECKALTAGDCPVIFYNQHLIGDAVKYCDEYNDIVCCPLPLNLQHRKNNKPLRPYEKLCKDFNEARPSCRQTPFIVDGTKAEPREFPFMALIGTRGFRKQHIDWDCGGTLIHPRFVVTAAHCLSTTETAEQRLDPNFDSPKFVVRLGELDYNSSTDDAQPQEFGLLNYVVHPSYDESDDGLYRNDIAILELDRNATINDYVAPACLPPSSGNDHIQLTAAGWGYTSNAGQKSSHLLKVTLDRFDDELCGDRLSIDVENRTQFCAGSMKGNGDTCNGDSGGPLFVQHPQYNCLKIFYGVTSFGQVCGRRGLPSVYTKVHLYTDWIENIVWGK